MTFECLLADGWYGPGVRPVLEAVGFRFAPANEWGNAFPIIQTAWWECESLQDFVAMAARLDAMPITLERRQYRDGQPVRPEAQPWLLTFALQE